jgi:ATP-binding cassette, subfamily F, member 3
MIGMSNVTKNQGGRTLYANASFQAQSGERVGLVGPNGAGKTTIFRLLTCEETPDQGQIIRPNSLTLGYFSQDVGEMHGRTVLEETMAGVEDLAALKSQISEMEMRLAEPMSDDEMSALLEKYGDAQATFESRCQSSGNSQRSRIHTRGLSTLS